MRYFLSYVVIQGSNTNTFGHAYCVLSQLADGPSAHLEVVESVGFYGDPVESDKVFQKKLFPARLFGPGHLKQEHLRHIASSHSYQQHHKTWEISESEKQAWLRKIELDRGKPLPPRDFALEHAQWQWLKELRKNPTEENKALIEAFAQEEEKATREVKGEYFSLFKNTCMTDAKSRLNDLGIPTKPLDNAWLDVPGWVLSPLVPMKLKYVDGKLLWNSPLLLTGRTVEQFHPSHWQQQLKAFYVNYKTLIDTLNKFEDYLKDNPNAPIELIQARDRLKVLKMQHKIYVQRPQAVNVQSAYALKASITRTVSQCCKALKPNCDSNAIAWLQRLLQWIQNHLVELGVWLNVGVVPSPWQFCQKQRANLRQAHENFDAQSFSLHDENLGSNTRMAPRSFLKGAGCC